MTDTVRIVDHDPVASSMAERGFYAACGFREVGEATAFWGEPVMVCALPCGPDAS